MILVRRRSRRRSTSTRRSSPRRASPRRSRSARSPFAVGRRVGLRRRPPPPEGPPRGHRRGPRSRSRRRVRRASAPWPSPRSSSRRIVWAPSHLLPLGRWAAQNAAQYKDEANYTRLGLLIRETHAARASAWPSPPPAPRRTSRSAPPRTSSARTIATSRSSRRAACSRPATTSGTTSTASASGTRDLIVETVDVNPTRRGVHREPRLREARERDAPPRATRPSCAAISSAARWSTATRCSPRSTSCT